MGIGDWGLGIGVEGSQGYDIGCVVIDEHVLSCDAYITKRIGCVSCDGQLLRVEVDKIVLRGGCVIELCLHDKFARRLRCLRICRHIRQSYRYCHIWEVIRGIRVLDFQTLL